MNENYTYILRCADGTYYCGWTNNLDRRLKAHNEGKGAKYNTFPKTRWPLSNYGAFSTKEEAMRREYEIKQLPRKKKEELIFKQQLIHHHVMAETSAHDKEMENFMGTEILVSRIENRQFQA